MATPGVTWSRRIRAAGRAALLALVLPVMHQSAPAPAAPAPAAIHYRGTLSHHWRGPVEGACDLRFQLWDAPLNGAPVGPPLLVSGVVLRGGALDVPVAASALGGQGDAGEGWLAVAVRCPAGGAEFSALAPRLSHITGAGAISGGRAAPGLGASALLCGLGAAPAAAHNQGPPLLNGAEYRLQGAFWSAGPAQP